MPDEQALTTFRTPSLRLQMLAVIFLAKNPISHHEVRHFKCRRNKIVPLAELPFVVFASLVFSTFLHGFVFSNNIPFVLVAFCAAGMQSSGTPVETGSVSPIPEY
jgi:hypothetical protein